MFVCLLLFVYLFVYCCLFICLFTVVCLFVCLLLFVVVLCPDLVSPPNGVVMMTNRSVGSVAEYSCDVGFQLIGMEQRTCLQNGTWTDIDPTCVGKGYIYYIIELFFF